MSNSRTSHHLRYQYMDRAGTVSMYTQEIAFAAPARPSSRIPGSAPRASEHGIHVDMRNSGTFTIFVNGTASRQESSLNLIHHGFCECDEVVPNERVLPYPANIRSSVNGTRVPVASPIMSTDSNRSSTISCDHGALSRVLNTSLGVVNTSPPSRSRSNRSSTISTDHGDRSHGHTSTLRVINTPATPPMESQELITPDQQDPTPATPSHRANRDSTFSYVQHDHGTLQPHYNNTMRVVNEDEPSHHDDDMSDTDSDTEELDCLAPTMPLIQNRNEARIAGIKGELKKLRKCASQYAYQSRSGRFGFWFGSQVPFVPQAEKVGLA